MATRKFENPALFICDIQSRFRLVIHEYPSLIATTQKMLRAAHILSIPILATTQLRAKLGDTDPDLQLDVSGGYPTLVHADKSIFSMWIPPVQAAVRERYGDAKMQVVIVGIESHICVTQTTLDLLADGHKVYVLADGVSSCNREEVPIALARLRAEGAVVTTSESWMYECMRDAAIPEFREISGVVRERKEGTKAALGKLCSL